MHFLIKLIFGLNLLWSCWITSWTTWMCFISFLKKSVRRRGEGGAEGEGEGGVEGEGEGRRVEQVAAEPSGVQGGEGEEECDENKEGREVREHLPQRAGRK